MERAAFVEQDLDATVLGAHAIPGQKRHRRRRRLGTAVALEQGSAIND
jgi:hypothetical protein